MKEPSHSDTSTAGGGTIFSVLSARNQDRPRGNVENFMGSIPPPVKVEGYKNNSPKSQGQTDVANQQWKEQTAISVTSRQKLSV